MCRLMWIFVEGGDDRVFVDQVLRPMLENEYDYVDVWEYAQQTHEKTGDFIRSMHSVNADYLFLRDIDTCPCVTERKQDLLKAYGKRIDLARAVVVVKEIESWYLAGLDDENRQTFGISPNQHRHTDGLTKEQFEALMPAKFDSVLDFMNEILHRFDVDTAKSRNRSFGYLMDLLETRSKEA